MVTGDTPKSVPDFNPVASESEWPEPDPLTEQFLARPYPAEVLPPLVRDAVTEAQAFVQAPIALVACSALSTLSLAAQGLVNVRRDHQLVGPVSLYMLAVADSGERKTTCDSIFRPALREWESERIREMSSEILEFEAMSAVHEAKKAGIWTQSSTSAGKAKTRPDARASCRTW